jgi:hypothetical protein
MSSLQKISRQGSVDSAPMLRRQAQRKMPVRLRVVRTVFANQLLPSLREKPLACGSSTVNRMHECEIARTSQLFYLNSTSRFDENRISLDTTDRPWRNETSLIVV